MDNIRIETVQTPVAVGYAEFTSPTLESLTSTLSECNIEKISEKLSYDGSSIKTFEEFKQMVDKQKYTPDYLRRIINYYCEELDIITDKIKEKGLQNEQWALDGMDRLNKISVKF